MEDPIIPKVGQVWKYNYTPDNGGDDNTIYYLVVTSLKPGNYRRSYDIIRFRYLDNWEDDEMSFEGFCRYCKLVNG